MDYKQIWNWLNSNHDVLVINYEDGSQLRLWTTPLTFFTITTGFVIWRKRRKNR